MSSDVEGSPVEGSPKAPPSSANGFFPRHFLAIKQYTEIFASISIVITAAIALFQYMGAIHSEKVNATLEFAMRLNEGELLESREALIQSWLPHLAMIEYANEIGGISAADRSRLLNGVLEQMERRGIDPQIEIFRIVDFLDQVVICIASSACDEETATTYFSDFALQFFCIYNEQILALRHGFGTRNLGLGLERLKGNRTCSELVG